VSGGKFGISLLRPAPNTIPPPFVPTFVTIPRFWTRAEPVGLTCVHPPPTPTQTESPAIRPVVFTPWIAPTAIPKPSSSSSKSCARIRVAGIRVGSPASAPITWTWKPAVPIEWTGVPFGKKPPDEFFTYSYTVFGISNSNLPAPSVLITSTPNGPSTVGYLNPLAVNDVSTFNESVIVPEPVTISDPVMVVSTFISRPLSGEMDAVALPLTSLSASLERIAV
jgi:hypothetical protein